MTPPIDPTIPPDKRASIIALMVEEGCSADHIDGVLAQHALDPLTAEEKVTYNLALPDGITAADVMSAPAPTAQVECSQDGDIDYGETVTVNPLTGQPFTMLNAQVVQLCSVISYTLRCCDAKSWKKYKEMKAADSTVAGKAKAYAWAWERLLKLGYQPTAKGQG